MPPLKPLFLGLDVGTQGTTALLYRAADNTVRGITAPRDEARRVECTRLQTAASAGAPDGHLSAASSAAYPTRTHRS